jgi:hypothetical protein
MRAGQRASGNKKYGRAAAAAEAMTEIVSAFYFYFFYPDSPGFSRI